MRPHQAEKHPHYRGPGRRREKGAEKLCDKSDHKLPQPGEENIQVQEA